MFLVLLFLLRILGASGTDQTDGSGCICSSGFVPIPVDVILPVDPSNPAGLNSSDTFRLTVTFDVYGQLCEPLYTNVRFENTIQLLLHGFTYTSQYWDFDANGFQNYSYVAYSCRNGISSFAYDTPGAGRTTRPKSAVDCQLPTASDISSTMARELKSGAVSLTLTGREKKYEKVVTIGHSQGSEIAGYAAIQDGAHSPFDGIILTGYIHALGANGASAPSGFAPASQVNPGRFPDLDPAYVTTVNESVRMVFYGPTPSSFSPDVFQLDFLTRDIGSVWIAQQIFFSFRTALGFSGHVAEMVGSLDQLLCTPSGKPCNRDELQSSEAFFYPNSRSFSMVVIDGFGHDLNLEFGAALAFKSMNELFESFVT